MLLTKEGEILKEAPENMPVEYDGITTIERKYRVIVICDIGFKKVMGEEDFDTEPEAIQILYCILKYRGNHNIKKLFAVINTVYLPVMQEYGLPFD